MLYSHRVKGPLTHLRDLIFGSPLRNTAFRREQLGILSGLAVLGSDALSSIAYATEEILLALSVIGPQAFCYAEPIAAMIVATLFIVLFSYRQTVAAYPNGGGAYTVAKHHLGRIPALVGAGSLLMDYVLTVAVSIAAGIRALTSLYPNLYTLRVELAIGTLLFIGWINLRGMHESVRLFAWPLYAFIVGMMILCGWGFCVDAAPIQHTPMAAEPLLNFVTLLVILRAFSGGCTALTGVEAIANAGPLIREPRVKNAQKIYVLLGSLLAILFLSITFLTIKFNIIPTAEQSLLSQLARLIMGDGHLYGLLQLSTAVVLLLAANTAFADYPRLCAILARDGWLPRQLATVGDRLVFHRGIVLLILLALMFLVLFAADVHSLIPLYAIGVLIAFTLSQYGMMHYWLKSPIHQHPCSSSPPLTKLTCWLRASLSGVGALTTFIVLIIFFEAKFTEGAYLTLIVIPCLCLMCYKIQHHYQQVEQQLTVTSTQMHSPRHFSKTGKRLAIVPISRLHYGSLEALALAREVSRHVVAVIVDVDSARTVVTQKSITDLNWQIDVVILPTPYRSVINPLIEYLSSFEKETLIIFPEIVPKKWWQKFLHNETVFALIKALEWQAPIAGQTRIIITVPYYLKK